jgi:hypothetical protein
MLAIKEDFLTYGTSFFIMLNEKRGYCEVHSLEEETYGITPQPN